MTSYEIDLTIQPKALKLLADGNYFFCMAKACGEQDRQLIYNVVALAATVTANMTVTWTDAYQMYGTTTVFNQGGILVSGSSDTRDIKFGQRYNLPSWSDPPTVVTDSSSPANGFTFNNGVVASAVVALKVTNPDGTTSFVPTYISPTPDIPGKDNLIPVAKVALWFQRTIKTSTMISLDIGNCCDLDLTFTQKQSVTYTDDGHWQTPGKFVDYTRAVPADTRRKERVQ
jgi:hypothetical protein